MSKVRSVQTTKLTRQIKKTRYTVENLRDLNYSLFAYNFQTKMGESINCVSLEHCRLNSTVINSTVSNEIHFLLYLSETFQRQLALVLSFLPPLFVSQILLARGGFVLALNLSCSCLSLTSGEFKSLAIFSLAVALSNVKI